MKSLSKRSDAKRMAKCGKYTYYFCLYYNSAIECHYQGCEVIKKREERAERKDK